MSMAEVEFVMMNNEKENQKARIPGTEEEDMLATFKWKLKELC